MEEQYVKVNKVLLTAVLSLCTGAIGAAAKSYIDVVELKTKVENYADTQHEIKEDIKDIKTDIKEVLKLLPKEG